MSRQRSRSPHYRRFPWEEPDFDPYKVLAELDSSPLDRSPRGDLEENLDDLGEDMYSEDQRRSPNYPDDRHFGHQRHPDQEEFYRRRPSPLHDVMDYDDRRFSPQREGGEDGERRRGGFREDFLGFDSRGRSPISPLRLPRESLPPTPISHPNQSQRAPGMGWRREEQARNRPRFRDLSPSDQRGEPGRERGRRNPQGPNRDRRREDPSQDRSYAFKRQRRDMDDVYHLGYGDEEEFGGQRYSVGAPGDGFGGDTHRGVPQGDARRLPPLVIEHDHGIEGREPPLQWKQDRDDPEDRDGHGPRLSPRPTSSSSQERFRMSNSRSEGREDVRGHHFQDNWRESNYHENRRSPLPQDRPNPVKYGNRDGSMNHRGRGGSRPFRGRFNRGQGGRTGPQRNPPRAQPSSQGYKDLTTAKQRPGFPPLREAHYEDPVEEEPGWPEEDRLQSWERERPALLDLRLPRSDLDPKMPRQREQQRERAWNEQKTKNMAVMTEETLTIKVDMSRPLNKNSQMCYSSDRQLSLDLVNVGRQRLDFLPMLEHSGTYRESNMHTGTFAQEIITLVHQVKEQYFRGDGATLNERFSAPQKGGYAEEETEELTLDERFSSNRGFSLNMESLLDDDEPLFSRLGPMEGLNQPPMRGPGDLRHDLERRRQEKLEGVKVTIPGSSLSQHRQMGSVSEQSLDYSDKDDMSQMEDEGFSSSWSAEQGRRREGSMGPRRGVSYRLNTGPQRRNNRFPHRQGPMRRHNNRAGPGW